MASQHLTLLVCTDLAAAENRGTQREMSAGSVSRGRVVQVETIMHAVGSRQLRHLEQKESHTPTLFLQCCWCLRRDNRHRGDER